MQKLQSNHACVQLRIAAALVLMRLTATLQAATPNFSSVPGTVVDWSLASSGIYVGSPSIVVMPDGTLVASHDEFGSKSTSPTDAVTRVFQSTDHGITWNKSYSIDNGGSPTAYGAEWNSLFNQGNTLYLMGVSKDYGNIVIRKSTDDGTTWTVPTNSSNGVLTPTAGYHTSTQRVVVQNGRIWRAFENINGGTGWPNWFQSFVMSAPIGADLTQAGNWTMSNALQKPASWNTASGNNGWLEGGVVSGLDGLQTLLRIDTNGPQRAAKVTVNSPTSVSFNPATDVVTFPGGTTKFTVQYDQSTGRYYTLSNPVPPGVNTTSPSSYRNTLALMSSTDLTHWQTNSIVLYNADAVKHAFQYVDWAFDGNDIVAASRTAFDDGVGGANSYHNANLLTFNRVSNYAALQPNFTLISDSGDATHPSKLVMMQTTAGAGTQGMYNAQTFATGTYAGAPLTNAFGIAQDLKGQVYVGEEKDGGRILRFDRSGDFLGVVATEGVNFTGRPESIVRGPDGDLYMSVAFGTNPSDKIYKIDPSGNVSGVLTPFIATSGSGPGGTFTLSDPRGIAFDSAGNFYVGDRNNNAIRRFNSMGQYLGNLATFTDPVQSLSFDTTDNQLLVSLGSSMVIKAVSLNGVVSSVLTQGSNTVLDVENIGGTNFYVDYSSSPPSVRRVDGATSDTAQTTLNDVALPGHLLAIGANSTTWTGGIDKSLSKARNWGLTVAPDFTGWETFKFGSVAATTITNDVSNATLGGLIVLAGAGAHTFIGNALTMGTGAAIINNSVNVLTLNTSSVFLNSLPIGTVGGDISINSPVTVGTTATVAIRGSHTVTFNGILSGSGNIDALEGTLILTNNANAFTGTTTIDGGVVRINSNQGLGATGSNTVIVGDGARGRLELAGSIAVAEPISLDGRQYDGAIAPHILNVVGNNVLTGQIMGTSNNGGTEWNLASNAGVLTIAGTFTNQATSGTQHLNLMGGSSGNLQSVVGDGIASVTSVVKSGTGTWTLSAADTFSGDTVVTAGSLLLTGTLASKVVTVAAGAVLVATQINALSTGADLTANGLVKFLASSNTNGIAIRTLSSISIGSNGVVSIADPGAANHANRTCVQVDTLTIAGAANAWSGQLDVAGNDLIIHNGDLSTLTNQINSEHAGGGIFSNSASADTTHLTTLGVIPDQAIASTQFDGITVSADDVLLKYTYFGDADLSGRVDASDYSRIDSGFLLHATGWVNGDFNYDGLINGSDYTLIDNAFNTQRASLTELDSNFQAHNTAEVSTVPEPSRLLLLPIMAGLLLRRRSDAEPQGVLP